jgi:hypothetical protein
MALDVFISYSHKDKGLRDELATHLSNLRRQGVISDWYDGDIAPGLEWKAQILAQLNKAKVILLLISADFMASDFCYSIEMQQAIARHQANQARVIPVILRPTDWEGAPFSRLKALPTDGKAVTDWPSHDNAFADVIKGLRAAIKTFDVSKPQTIDFSLQQGNIISFDTEVVALKYAQEFYGGDLEIASRLNSIGIPINTLRPEVGGYRFLETKGCIGAKQVLFVGVPDISYFNYPQIRQFAARVLNILAQVAPNTSHLSMTMHGVGYGLDEIEAIHAQLAGYLDAIRSGLIPRYLDSITIVEFNYDRVNRLRQALEISLQNASYAQRVPGQWAYQLNASLPNSSHNDFPSALETIEEAGITSEKRAHAFVAMPFAKEMDDIFYYGIQQPVRSAGLLCERIDQEAFTGDILERVKMKIETAAVVIADLSGANPNVYLEVGYAWGKGRPTILLVKSGQELRFDVRGQKCLKYERIRDLEEALGRELTQLL